MTNMVIILVECADVGNNKMNFFKKILNLSTNNDIKTTANASTVQTESATLAVTETKKTTTKPKLPRKKKEKNKKEEPRVSVIKFDFDTSNPQVGSMELDWNAEFIEMLRQAGYRGVNPEALVDAWLNDVARNILASSQQNNVTNLDGSRYVNRKDLGDGRSEVS